jgi:hypothetical protein
VSARWLPLALLVACGGSGADPAAGVERGAARTIVVFVLDGLRADLDHDVAPLLAALERASLTVPGYVTACTGTNAAVASLLTGLPPEQHGLGSLHDRGRAALADELQTLAERFLAAGWSTQAVFSSPQLGLSGLEQGFEAFAVPALSERGGRTAEQSFQLARAGVATQLADERPALLVVHLADLRQDDAPPEAGAFLARELAGFAEPGSELAAVLARAASDPAGALADARRLLGRARGSASYAALARALHDGRLARLDRQVGAFLDLARDAGRLDGALVVVVSTRGALLAPPQQSGGPAFLPEVMRVPLWLRLPGPGARGALAGTASSLDLAPTLLAVLGAAPADLPGEDLLAPAPPGADRAARVVRACDARLERWAAFDVGLHVEQNSASPDGVVAFDRTGLRVRHERPDVLDADVREALARLRAALDDAPRFGLRVDSLLPELEVRWRFADGFARDAGCALASGAACRVSNADGRVQATLAGAGHAWVEASRRDLPLRLTLAAPGLDEGQVGLGAGLPLAATLLPRLAAANAPPWPAGRAAEVSLRHEGGVWARLSVGGAAGRSVEALVVLYPPDANDRSALEWSAPFDVEVTPLAGRSDAVLVRGTTPFELQLKELPRTQLAFAVRADVTVAPEDVRIDDRCMGAPGVVDLYVPDWLAGVTGLLEEPAGVLPPPVLVRRTGSRAPLPGHALGPDERQFARFLGAGE